MKVHGRFGRKVVFELDGENEEISFAGKLDKRFVGLVDDVVIYDRAFNDQKGQAELTLSLSEPSLPAE